MLVRTREAAVCAIASLPAVGDCPRTSVEAWPVTGSLGGKMDTPVRMWHRGHQVVSDKPRS